MDKLEYVGDYKIVGAEIITSENLLHDIAKSILSIDFFEDIENGAVMGEMYLSDSFALDTIGPLIGQEYLSLSIRTPTISDSDPANSIHFGSYTGVFKWAPFQIYHFVGRQNFGNKGQAYFLKFITSEFVQNSRTLVSKTYTGSYSDIVQNILKKDIKTPKECYIEPSVGNKKIIAPNISPFDVIQMAKRESISAYNNSPTYFFYETKAGYYFRSVESMAAEGTVQDYTTFPAGSKYCDGLEKTAQEYSKIIGFNIVNDNDTLMHQQTGTFSSKTITHDIYNKRYDTTTYNYHKQFEKESHMNQYSVLDEFPAFSPSPVDWEERTISDFPVKTYYMPVSHKQPYEKLDGSYLSKSGKPIYQSTKPTEYMGRRTSRMMQLKAGREVVITVPGRCDVSAGQMVNIELPIKAIADVDKRKMDRFFDGPFLIKRVRHNFVTGPKPTHTMYLNCIKDCTNENFAGEDYFMGGVGLSTGDDLGVTTDFYNEVGDVD